MRREKNIEWIFLCQFQLHSQLTFLVVFFLGAAFFFLGAAFFLGFLGLLAACVSGAMLNAKKEMRLWEENTVNWIKIQKLARPPVDKTVEINESRSSRN